MHDNADIGMAPTVGAELERQLENLLAKGYPALAGSTDRRFCDDVRALRDLLPDAVADEPTRIPFVVVVQDRLVPVAEAVTRIEVRGRTGWTDMATELDRYRTIPGIDVPAAGIYLLTDADVEPGLLGVAPVDALPLIQGAGRTVITIAEAVALATQFPDLLTVRNAFQALGSRADNKRIPSVWVSKGAPRLGWCWAGNPHSWLAAASAGARLAAAATDR